ncbi:MAG: HNH endonuclease [Bacteroidales bacterium]|nr:HNH endonuclease [Bacteroidales bacterium]
MEKRTKEFLQVSFYLSKFGESSEHDKYPSPPKRLKVEKWNEAYRMFYEKLSGGRNILAFERSLKNARDAFDSHSQNSGRIGWRAKNRKPNPLGKEAQIVFDKFGNLTEEEVWNQIRYYSDLRINEYKQVIEDLISVQESEEEYKKGKTEGGQKVFTSSKYERSPSARNNAIKIHGLKCKVCGFDFKEVYGEWGEGFIEVHHLQALADNQGEEIETNPETDLIVVCANCHRMLHRKKGMTLTIEELKEKIF